MLRGPVSAPSRAEVNSRIGASVPGNGVVEWVQGLNRRLGVPPESATYLAAVEDWRDAWRPQRVRVLLVAESHVAEHAGDDGVRVVCDRPDLPSDYCRLVYCLGYGDSTVCRPRAPASNRGTPQYWRIFATLAAGEPTPAAHGVRAKLAVLEKLREAGVWLVDASVAGIYEPGGTRRFPQREYSSLVRESYERFVAPKLAGEEPEIVSVIGKGVYQALEGLPFMERARFMYQPNAWGQFGTQHRSQLEELASRVRGSR